MILSPPVHTPWTIRARWVFPVDAPPIPDGRVTLQAGRITRVAPDGPADQDVGNAALLPGFVNAHTHLDLGMLRGKCSPTPDFPGWLRCVIAGRRAATSEQVEQAIRDGVAECVRCGTTLVGDISAGGASWPLLAAAPLRSVVFYELLGLPLERADAAWQRARAWLASVRTTERCRPGLSPHAPYSVRRDLFQRAAASGLPMAIHLAESRAELELLREHTGPFVDFLRDLNVFDETGLVSGPEELLAIYRDMRPVLWAHGNYLPADAEIEPGQSIVYCPRTHAAFGHAPHPLPALLARGVRVALGTDSLASNPDLDILAEARFVHARYPEVNGDVLLRMLTLRGAEALGWGGETGSLTPGKFADVVVLSLPDKDPADPHELLWEPS
jgi:cytosine/adenosine deaminase-related metal-dependent hydrolase